MDDATALDHQFSIGHDETYTVNVIMTTGVKEHVRESDNKSPTLFYRNLDEQAPQSGQQRAPYVPKMKNARQTMVQLMDAYGVFPFNVRSLTLKQRLGFQECVKHGLYHGVPVMEAKRGDVTAQFKFTVAISGARSEAVRITNAGLPLPYVHSSMELPVELQTLMKVSAKVVKAARVVPGAGAMEVDA